VLDDRLISLGELKCGTPPHGDEYVIQRKNNENTDHKSEHQYEMTPMALMHQYLSVLSAGGCAVLAKCEGGSCAVLAKCAISHSHFWEFNLSKD